MDLLKSSFTGVDCFKKSYTRKIGKAEFLDDLISVFLAECSAGAIRKEEGFSHEANDFSVHQPGGETVVCV
jgi:hypothetical protein